jgi:thiamine-phosphate diphosphorylase
MRRPTLWPGLYAIADADFGDPVHLGIQYMLAGCKNVQIRAKNWPHERLLVAATQLVAKAKELGATLIVNDDVLAARLSEAHGVHIGQGDASVATARALLGAKALIGLSTHDLCQVRHDHGADYIGFGPVFSTNTKAAAGAEKGIQALAKATTESPCPVIAIGGINGTNLYKVESTGCYGWAIISALHDGPNVQETIAKMGGFRT